MVYYHGQNDYFLIHDAIKFKYYGVLVRFLTESDAGYFYNFAIYAVQGLIVTIPDTYIFVN